MTTATASVITPERFAQGYTWSDYTASIKANKERFLKFYNELQIRPDDAAFFQRFNQAKGPVKVLAIGEDWCPDVVRGLPVGARIAEAAGMDLRIFPRDTNLDLMNLYLWRHQYMCIPVFAFFDKDWRELGHWTERPASGYKFLAELRDELRARNLNEEETLKVMRERREPVQASWMQDTVTEIREQVLTRVL